MKNDHRLVPSSPVVPFDDPTILFINAGMNQFKDIFTGKQKADFPRATSVQKCIRAGGKHNDLDNVGFTARHHTFFEMLGNWSFGDYYKEEAIKYAWEWITEYLKLPTDRLYATVYETDDEAFELWEKIAPELRNGRIMRFGKKDNWWSMGDVGPCGPCSEIHFDRGEKYGTGPEDKINGETDRFVEIWNLVFMQYDQSPEGQQTPLPKPSVDTGAGLERIAAIMQSADNNYGIDLFQNLVAAVSDLTGARYKDNVASHHVVADHIRALTFALADGAGISNEGRGYVLRRILRRAARHGRKLGATEPFLYRLVPTLVDEMGDVYPEICEKGGYIVAVIKNEEEKFDRTLELGLGIFSRIARGAKSSGSQVVKGEEAFELYDTYGFPYDLTEVMATEHQLTVDRVGYDRCMMEQRKRSGKSVSFKDYAGFVGNQPNMDGHSTPSTNFERQRMSVRAALKWRYLVRDETEGHETVLTILLDTPFYCESGGQISDIGEIRSENFTIKVVEVFKQRDWYVHRGTMTRGSFDDIEKGAFVTASVDVDRRWDIMRNHTATHLAHAALRKVLGVHVHQSGSYVGPDRLRFDFSHHQPVTPNEIARIEEMVNAEILKGTDVTTEEMTVDEAKASGATALFGEKYGETVRVVSVDDFSKELCGGTHVKNVSQIGPFFITLETGIASGIRRLEAITGREAHKQMLSQKHFQQEVSRIVGRPESEALLGVELLKETNTSLQKELKKVKADLVAGQGQTVGTITKVGEVELWTHDFGPTDKDTMSTWIDVRKEQSKPVMALGIGDVDGKLTLMFTASSSAVKFQGIHIGKMTKQLLSEFGGRGGGKPDFAQGGLPPYTNLDEVFASLVRLVKAHTG